MGDEAEARAVAGVEAGVECMLGAVIEAEAGDTRFSCSDEKLSGLQAMFRCSYLLRAFL